MPTYQNVTPPSSLFSGDVGFSFNNEAFPGSATSGTQFALPSFTGTNDPGTAVRWQTIFGTNPTAVNIVLQGALADVSLQPGCQARLRVAGALFVRKRLPSLRNRQARHRPRMSQGEKAVQNAKKALDTESYKLYYVNYEIRDMQPSHSLLPQRI